MIFKILPNPNHSVHVLHTTIFSNSLGSNFLGSNFLGSNSPSRIPPCRGRQQCSCRLCTGSAFAAASGALQDSLAFCSGWKFSGQGAEDHRSTAQPALGALTKPSRIQNYRAQRVGNSPPAVCRASAAPWRIQLGCSRGAAQHPGRVLETSPRWGQPTVSPIWLLWGCEDRGGSHREAQSTPLPSPTSSSKPFLLSLRKMPESCVALQLLQLVNIC